MRKILISMGDPLGIGPEIIVKSLRKLKGMKIIPVVVGHEGAMKRAGWRRNLAPLVNVSHEKLSFAKTAPDPIAGKISFRAFSLAYKLVSSGMADALVTAPISKESWRAAGADFPGHTDFLRRKSGRELLMSFVRGNVRVSLLTEHIPLSETGKRINAELIGCKLRLFRRALVSLGVKNPKICVAAPNPHAGDGGLMGREEKMMAKAVGKAAFARGPFPSDKAWLLHIGGKFDGLLASYHDQALLPIKLIGRPFSFVHWTYGLPFVRTSPAHGTAFDIAWKGKADFSGMLEAIRFAAFHGRGGG